MKSDMGHKEWLNEYPALKQIPAENAFTVPEGYFNELEQRITSAIKLEELRSGKGFAVPENYFDELSNNIQSRINIESFVNNEEAGHAIPANYFNELTNNIQSRINIESFVNNEEAGHAIPANYFDELSSNIQSRINIEAFVNNEEEGHAIPANYFENFEQQVNSRIAVEEILNQEESFTVPADYFNKLNKAILNKTVNQKMVKRKSKVIRMFSSTAFKYAAAACFVVAIGGGVLITQLSAPIAVKHQNTFLHKQLSTVSTGDIQSYLQDDVDPTETQHTVIDENDPVSDAGLSNALQNDNTTN